MLCIMQKSVKYLIKGNICELLEDLLSSACTMGVLSDLNMTVLSERCVPKLPLWLTVHKAQGNLLMV